MKKTILFAFFAFLCLGTALPVHAKQQNSFVTRPQEEIRKTEFFEYFSSLYEINPTKVFDLVDTAAGYRKYTNCRIKRIWN